MMKARKLNQKKNTPFLKVVNKSLSKTNVVKGVCINTLVPGFKHTNNEGALITPNKFAIL
jgi:hypothetical protein